MALATKRENKIAEARMLKVVFKKWQGVGYGLMMVFLKDFCFAHLEGDVKSRISSRDSKKEDRDWHR